MQLDWQPAKRSNYGGTRDLTKIDTIILHTVEGSFDSCINTFKSDLGGNPRSSHYVISQDGRAVKMVNENYVAWHCAGHNFHSIGIEQEGKSDNPKWCTDQLIEATSIIVASICKRLGIPPSREHIRGHNEMPWHHSNSDVGPHYRWDALMDAIRTQLAK